MRTKLYVWGAVLGTAPGLLPVIAALWALPAQPRKEEPREEPVRPEGPRPRGPASGAPGPVLPVVPAALEPEVPVHPCELITVMKVPCEATAASCEYTYWECPRNVKPLRA
jgi:hypothetical protein